MLRARLPDQGERPRREMSLQIVLAISFAPFSRLLVFGIVRLTPQNKVKVTPNAQSRSKI
ncbi:unnamed protein product [Leptidea sinapis]|uniref:Uncharacterized protein n=1 Tax=Leptidea sinapis TaxID=189913 RepID=A0A5E4QM32_9NEOP|nr:unnamed protein product [Leptidea sinapis]